MSGPTGPATRTVHVRRLTWRQASLVSDADRKWPVTSRLGLYSSNTVAGAITRRFHGLLVAALPSPMERVMMLHYPSQRTRGGSQAPTWPNAYGEDGRLGQPQGSAHLVAFRLDGGLPVWTYASPRGVIERSLLMLFGQNRYT